MKHGTNQDAFRSALSDAVCGWGLSLGTASLDQLAQHFQHMTEANRGMNLTRITDPVAAAVKHYADSLALLRWVAERGVEVSTVLDVGTGAGFPAVPLAVARPDWSVTAIDATRKKAEFVQRTAVAIGLANLRCEHAHSQHWQADRPFTLVTFRALTNLARAVRQTVQHLAPDGWLVAYKTASVDPREMDEAGPVAPKLHLALHEHYPYDLALQGKKLGRVLYVYKKSS